MKIEQMLYGYRNGHTLLASSVSGRLKNQSVVDVLSDAAGSGVFEPYLSGYPLVEDGYYAFSKTWYADDMPRPGCVWTHILLFPIKYEKNAINADLTFLFKKPEKDSYDFYRNSISLDGIGIDRIDYDKVENYYGFFLYTLFSSDNSIYVCDKNGAAYESSIMDIVLKLPEMIRSEFSVCTGTRTNRFLHDRIFSYQIASERVAKTISKKAEDAIVYKSAVSSDGFPIWTQFLVELFRAGKQEELFCFTDYYAVGRREEIKELSKLYYAEDRFEKKQDFGKYLLLFDKISEGMRFQHRTIDDVVYSESFGFYEYFSEETVLRFFVNDIIKASKGGNKQKRPVLEEPKKERYAKLLYSDRDTLKVKQVFDSYIHNKLDKDGIRLVDELIKYIKPIDLERLFALDRSICNVLIIKKPELALCTLIWKQDVEFQKEMLGATATGGMDQHLKVKLCKIIVEESLGGIALLAEQIMGDNIRNTIFERAVDCAAMEEFSKPEDFVLVKEWLPIMVKNRDLYMELLRKELGWPIVHSLMSIISTFHIGDEEEYDRWSIILNKHEERILKEDVFTDALFALGIMLHDIGRFSDAFQSWVFDRVNERMENNELSYEDWIGFEALLPPIEIERSWDKCLRLRMAFGKE